MEWKYADKDSAFYAADTFERNGALCAYAAPTSSGSFTATVNSINQEMLDGLTGSSSKGCSIGWNKAGTTVQYSVSDLSATVDKLSTGLNEVSKKVKELSAAMASIGSVHSIDRAAFKTFKPHHEVLK